MAINLTIRLFASVLLAGVAVPALGAQEPSDSLIGGGVGVLQSAKATTEPTMPESAPKAPKVTCEGGQLRISANNSTLGSVLSAVHACLGVQIDIPEGVGTERMFEELGPGPEREVLESLLSGADFNYVIGSSDANPQKVETVLLMERKTEVAMNTPPTDRSLTPARRIWMESLKSAKRAAGAADDSSLSASDSPDTPAAEEPTPAPVPADNATASAGQAPASDTPVPVAPSPDASSTPSVVPGIAVTPSGSPGAELSPSIGPDTDTSKSTEERIAEMQQMFAQRKQITQSQGPATSLPQTQSQP